MGGRRSLRLLWLAAPLLHACAEPPPHTETSASKPSLPVAPPPIELPRDRSGLVLWAQRSVEMHLDSPDGAVIGRLHPGAMVGVVPFGPAHFLVAVPRYRLTGGGLLNAYVERDALSSTPTAEAAPVQSGEVLRDFGAVIRLGDGGVYVQLLCGDLRREPDGRISQYYRGVEIRGADTRGLMGETLEGRRGQARCPPPHVYRDASGFFLHDGRDGLDRTPLSELPRGYLAVSLPAPDPMEKAIAGGATIHWLVRTATGFECEAWKFGPSDGTGMPSPLRAKLHRVGDVTRATYGVRYPPIGPTPGATPPAPGLIELTGPQWNGGGRTCVLDRRVVGVAPDRFYLDAIFPSQQRPDAEIVGFSPDQAQHWFTQPEPCEQARRAANEAAKADPDRATYPGMHDDCAPWRQL